MSGNFTFLSQMFPAVENLGTLAESYLYSDPNTCLYKMGVLAETIVNYMVTIQLWYFNLSGMKYLKNNFFQKLIFLSQEPQKVRIG